MTKHIKYKIRRHFNVKVFCRDHLKQSRQPEFKIFPSSLKLVKSGTMTIEFEMLQVNFFDTL